MARHDLILTLILSLLLPGCSDHDEPDGSGGEDRVIEFDEPFVSHVARSSSLSPGFDSFRLFGFVIRPDSYIYDGEIVRRQSSGLWRCDRTEYWYPGKTYYFTGIAPVESKGLTFNPAIKGNATIPGGGTIGYDIGATEAKEDLLYAFSMFRTSSPLGTYIPPVEMEFTHLLSQITFTFHNDLGNPHYFINIPNVVIRDIAREASVDMTRPEPVWQRKGQSSVWVGTNSEILAVHTGRPQTSVPLYILPLNHKDAGITIYTQVFYTDEAYGTVGHRITDVQTIEIPFPDLDLRMGHAYNLVCHLSHSNVEGGGGNLQPITFTVEDGNWKYDYYIDAP